MIGAERFVDGEEDAMVQTIAAENLVGHSEIEIKVSGPKGANRLYVVTGRAPVIVDSTGTSGTSDSISFLIGPKLKNKEFHRASASVSLADMRQDGEGRGRWSIEAVDADWDDESGRTQVRVDIEVWGGPNSSARVRAIGYHATILAET